MPQFYKGDRPVAEKVGTSLLGIALFLGIVTHSTDGESVLPRSQPLVERLDAEKQEKWDALPEPTVRLTGVIPGTVSEDINREHVHKSTAEDAVALTFYQSPVLALSDTDLTGKDFVISASVEDTAVIESKVSDHRTLTMGYSPLVLATNNTIAGELQRRGIAKDLGGQNYRINVRELLELLDGGITWGELGNASDRGSDEASILVPDPDLSATAAKWAQVVALATTGAESFTTEEEAQQWARLPQVESIDYSFGENPRDLIRAVEDRNGNVFNRIVVTTEDSFILQRHTRDGEASPIALMYPDIQLPVEYSFIALTKEGQRFGNSSMSRISRAPFTFSVEFEANRDPQWNDRSFESDTVGRPLVRREDLNLREVGDPEAALAFTKAAVPGDINGHNQQELERPKYAK